jgi:transposase-like protein
MNDGIREIRNQVRAHCRSRASTTVRYPASVREAAVAVAREGRRAGRSIGRTARQLGLSPGTLLLWMRRGGAGRLRRVEVLASPRAVRDGGATRPVLVTPQGFRVEGLDTAELTALLRALS